MFKSVSMSLIARGILALAVGIIALAWPGPTALVLVLIVAVWAMAVGLVEIAAAFQADEPAGTRALYILGGLVTVAFGMVLCARPGVGAVTLALLFGLFNLIAGAWMLVQCIELRRTGNTLHPAAWGRPRPEPGHDRREPGSLSPPAGRPAATPPPGSPAHRAGPRQASQDARGGLTSLPGPAAAASRWSF